MAAGPHDTVNRTIPPEWRGRCD